MRPYHSIITIINDNDGDVDLFLTTVGDPYYPGDYSVLYRNEGNWNFTDVTGVEGLYDAMPHDPLCGYQAAWADFDNDGDLDLITDGKLFENQGNTNNWLRVRLESKDSRINRNAIGSHVLIELKDRKIIRQVEAGTGEGNQNEFTLHFGLGKHEGPIDLKIRWRKGIEDVYHIDKGKDTIKITFPISKI